MAAGGRSYLSWVSLLSAGRFGVDVFVFVEGVEVGGGRCSMKDWRQDVGSWGVGVARAGVQILMGNNKLSRSDNSSSPGSYVGLPGARRKDARSSRSRMSRTTARHVACAHVAPLEWFGSAVGFVPEQ